MNTINEKLTKYLIDSPLFFGITEDGLTSLISDGLYRNYKRGEVIRDSQVTIGGLGIVITGSIVVKKGSSVINKLSSGTIVGVADLFRKNPDPPSVLIANSETLMFILPKDVVIRQLHNSDIILENYLAVLSSKIDFLTKHIEAISGSSASQKLEDYIRKSPGGILDCTNMSFLAKKLDMGRATLYRAINTLEQQNTIVRTDNKLMIKNNLIGDLL